MSCYHQYPDDISYRLIADACAAGFLPERAIDLMVVMERQGVIMDSKIATAISIAFSGSENTDVASMTAGLIFNLRNDNFCLSGITEC